MLKLYRDKKRILEVISKVTKVGMYNILDIYRYILNQHKPSFQLGLGANVIKAELQKSLEKAE